MSCEMFRFEVKISNDDVAAKSAQPSTIYYAVKEKRDFLAFIPSFRIHPQSPSFSPYNRPHAYAKMLRAHAWFPFPSTSLGS